MEAYYTILVGLSGRLGFGENWDVLTQLSGILKIFFTPHQIVVTSIYAKRNMGIFQIV